jgi:hypothetical protein
MDRNFRYSRKARAIINEINTYNEVDFLQAIWSHQLFKINQMRFFPQPF